MAVISFILSAFIILIIYIYVKSRVAVVISLSSLQSLSWNRGRGRGTVLVSRNNLEEPVEKRISDRPEKILKISVEKCIREGWRKKTGRLI